jgi:hypothetical protein
LFHTTMNGPFSHSRSHIHVYYKQGGGGGGGGGGGARFARPLLYM